MRQQLVFTVRGYLVVAFLFDHQVQHRNQATYTVSGILKAFLLQILHQFARVHSAGNPEGFSRVTGAVPVIPITVIRAASETL